MAELTESGHAFLGKAAEGVAAARLRQQQRSAARKVIPRNAAGVDLRLGRNDIYRWGQRGKDWFPNQEELFAKVPIDPDVFFVAVDRPNYVDWTAELQHLVINPDRPIVKGYLHFASPEEFFAKADSLSLRYPLCAYEMIPEGTPVRGFFDLEVEPASAWAGDELAMCQSVLDLLNAVAGPLGHPKVALSDCTVSSASVPAKRSCHLVVLNAWWPCISDLRRVVAVMLDRADALRYERPKEGGSVASFCLLDRTTGHKQLYRTAGSYKGKHDVASDMIVATRRLEPVQLPGMVALELRGREDYLATGMGHDWLDAHHRMKLDTELAASLLPRPMRSGKLRPHGMTAEATSALEARIQAWCTEHGISVPIIPGTCNDDGSWQCGVAAVCAIAGRRHKSNRARCRTTGAAVEWGCYDEECRKRGWRPLFSLVQFASADEEEETAAPVAGEEDDSGAAPAPVGALLTVAEPVPPPSYEAATEDPAIAAQEAELAARKARRASEQAAAKAKRAAERAEEKKLERAIEKAKEESHKAKAQERLTPVQTQVEDFKARFIDAADARSQLEFPWERLHEWADANDNDILRKCAKRLVDLLLPVLGSYWNLVQPNTGGNYVVAKRPETLQPLRKRDPPIDIQDHVYRGQKAFMEEVRMVFLGINLADAWLAQPTLLRWRGADWQPPYASRRMPGKWLDLWPGQAFAHEEVDRRGDASVHGHGAFFERFIVEGLAQTENEASADVREMERLETCFPKPPGWEQRLAYLRLRHPGQFLWDSICMHYTYPGKNPRYILILTGEGGSGKTTAMRVLCKLHGDRLWTKADLNEITGQFNGGLKHKLLVFAEEITVSNSKDAEAFKRIADADVIRIRLMRQEFANSTWAGWIVVLNNSDTAPFHVSGTGGNRKTVPYKVMHGLLEKGGWNAWGGAACGRWMDEEMDLYSVGARMLKRGRELGADHDLTSRMPMTLGMREQHARAVAADPARSFFRDILEKYETLDGLRWGDYYPMPLLHSAFLKYWEKDDKVVRRFAHMRSLTEELDRVFGVSETKDVRCTTLEKRGIPRLLLGTKDRLKCRLLPSEEEVRSKLKLEAAARARDLSAGVKQKLLTLAAAAKARVAAMAEERRPAEEPHLGDAVEGEARNLSRSPVA